MGATTNVKQMKVKNSRTKRRINQPEYQSNLSRRINEQKYHKVHNQCQRSQSGRIKEHKATCMKER